jgi:hypothetical protein
VRVPVVVRFSSLNVFWKDSRPHSASYPMGTGEFYPGIKRSRLKTDHSPLTSAEVKNTWIHTSTPHTFSWRSAQLVKRRINFAFFIKESYETNMLGGQNAEYYNVEVNGCLSWFQLGLGLRFRSPMYVPFEKCLSKLTNLSLCYVR